jgi:hypothetical protein
MLPSCNHESRLFGDTETSQAAQPTVAATASYRGRAGGGYQWKRLWCSASSSDSSALWRSFHQCCRAGNDLLSVMAQRSSVTFPSVTLGHIRGHGCRDPLVYCAAMNCSHRGTLNADRWPDDTPIRPLGKRMVCTRCGHIGADVRPDWSPHVNKRHV